MTAISLPCDRCSQVRPVYVARPGELLCEPCGPTHPRKDLPVLPVTSLTTDRLPCASCGGIRWLHVVGDEQLCASCALEETGDHHHERTTR